MSKQPLSEDTLRVLKALGIDPDTFKSKNPSVLEGSMVYMQSTGPFQALGGTSENGNADMDGPGALTASGINLEYFAFIKSAQALILPGTNTGGDETLSAGALTVLSKGVWTFPTIGDWQQRFLSVSDAFNMDLHQAMAAATTGTDGESDGSLRTPPFRPTGGLILDGENGFTWASGAIPAGIDFNLGLRLTGVWLSKSILPYAPRVGQLAELCNC